MHANREATDAGRVAPGVDTRFTVFPVAESTQVHNLFSVAEEAEKHMKTVFHLGSRSASRAMSSFRGGDRGRNIKTDLFLAGKTRPICG
jgi:hypothetical protein